MVLLGNILFQIQGGSCSLFPPLSYGQHGISDCNKVEKGDNLKFLVRSTGGLIPDEIEVIDNVYEKFLAFVGLD